MDAPFEKPVSGAELRALRVAMKLSQVKLAEISSVPQHLISAFELGRLSLSEEMLRRIQSVVENSEQVNSVVNRKKRYRAHEYAKVGHDHERVARAQTTLFNRDYVLRLQHLWGQHLITKDKKLDALSLFSGCGGFSLGFSAAGFKIKGYLELDEDLRRIYSTNFPTAECLGGDISEIENSAIEGFAGKLGNVDVLIGGPPCQGFSLTGKRQVADPRNFLFKSYMKFVDAFNPKIAVVENVSLLTSMRNPQGGWVKDDIANEFSERGYKLRLFDVNAKYYGVPQSRSRVFFVATRGDLDVAPSFPSPTHGNLDGLFGHTRSIVTFGDACSDLVYLESGEASSDPMHRAVNHPAHVINWLWDVKEGFSAHDNVDPSMRPPSGYNTTYKRQVWSEPAATVQTTFGMISGSRNVHPIATRALTMREACRLQSFPDQFKFLGTDGAIRTGIGNAVPPLLAYKIAKHLADLL